MAIRICELKGSGDFTTGPSGVQGTMLYMILGATDQDTALGAVLSETPSVIAGIPRGSCRISSDGAGVYRAEVEYVSNVKVEGEQGAGDPPTGGEGPEDGRPDGKPEGKNPGDPVGKELSFTTGGGTERIYISKRTIHAVARKANANGPALAAPNFHRMIGVSQKGIEGCEVFSRKCEFTVAQRFKTITHGYLAKLFALTATTNKKAFRGTKPGESLFMGADGNHKDGDQMPWWITGRFGYSPNLVKVDIDDEKGILQLPTVGGWNHVWCRYEQTTEEIGGVKYQIERPRFAYCEQVYDDEDFAALKMG